ncbi:MAG: serpin family protein [candidate division Zixibacteria bacterium]|nr:serpin family protein [candidate division Zixibacteria bacterium]
MHWFRVIFLLLCAALFCQFCSHGTAPEQTDPGPSPQPARTPEEFTDNEKASAGSMNEFGLKLFRTLDAEANLDTNLFISPLSVAVALGMAYNGAEGQTKEEIAEVLESAGLSLNEFNESYLGIQKILTQLDPDVIMRIANSIWYRQDLTIASDYIANVKDYFNAEIYGVNFMHHATADSINNWINVNTSGMITKMIDPPIDPAVITMIINAIYFKGSWTNPFDTAQTDSTIFFKSDGSTVECDMMAKDSILPFYSNDMFTATYLPYGNEYFNMMILSPENSVSINDVIDSLTKENWDLWRSSFTEHRVLLGLPKMRFEYGLDLKDLLIDLGMPTAFSGGADFSNMFPNVPMFISRALHKAKIQVDEFGTEAAAVTVLIGEVSMPPQVYCNRPFVFVIYEKTTGTIIFIGKVAEPVWES